MVKNVTGWPKFQIRTISNFSETKSGEPVAQLPVFINTISYLLDRTVDVLHNTAKLNIFTRKRSTPATKSF